MVGGTVLYQASTLAGSRMDRVVLPSSGILSSQSSAYILKANPHCFMLFMQVIACALDLALERAGSSIAARMAMMAMTTSSSMSVKASKRERLAGWFSGTATMVSLGFDSIQVQSAFLRY